MVSSLGPERHSVIKNLMRKTREVFYNNAVNFAHLDVLNHFLKCWTVKAFTTETVVDENPGQLIPDPVAAVIVRKIFEMAANGTGAISGVELIVD